MYLHFTIWTFDCFKSLNRPEEWFPKLGIMSAMFII